jgi:pyruvate,water dikinase
MNQPYITHFNNPLGIQNALTGGKGANLAKMLQAGFPVPIGFCVTTTAYAQFVKIHQLDDAIIFYMKELSLKDPNQIKEHSAAIRNLIQAAPIPEVMIRLITEAWEICGTNTAYAVRSSATAEDMPFASFAGQQDTYLNIKGAFPLLEAIRNCWASLFTERAVTYRIQNGFDHIQVQIAVVVQQMINADVSGILFTADPVTNNHKTISINASYGLGEALVSGLVNPDLVRVDKDNLNVLQYEISKKEVMIESSDNGTHKIPVAPDKMNSAALTPSQIAQLINLGKQVETYYGVPQDIEWAISQDQLYLLQTRPITSLFPIPAPCPVDTNLHIYFSFGHAQMMTEPISPMGISVLQLFLPFGRPLQEVSPSPYLLTAGGRIYADITTILNTKKGKHLFPNILVVAEPVAANQIRHIVASPAFQKRNQKPATHLNPRTFTDWILPIFIGMIGWLLFGNISQPSKQTLEKNQAFLDTYYNHIQGFSGVERLIQLESTMAVLLKKGVVWMAPIIGCGVLSINLLTRMLKTEQQREYLKKIQRGLEGNITTEMDLMVGDLAAALANSPDLIELFEQVVQGKRAWEENLLDSFPDFQLLWQQFIQRYGMRGPGEIDIARPRWQVQPQSLLQIMLSNLTNQNNMAHREHYAQLIAESKIAQENLLKTLPKSLTGWLKKLAVRRLLLVFTRLAPLREHPKYMIVRFMDMMRKEIQVAANQMHTEGKLETPEDIWYLRMEELCTAFADSEELPLRELILERKLDYQHFSQLTPPRVITSDGEIPTTSLSIAGLSDGALVGSPVSTGVVEGLARVILDPRIERLQSGEILVAPYTDPGWTPLFIHAAGVVLETGGLMTHGSVIAREYGIPAVVGIIDATRKITTGMRIRVNGDIGYVEIIDNPIE